MHWLSAAASRTLSNGRIRISVTTINSTSHCQRLNSVCSTAAIQYQCHHCIHSAPQLVYNHSISITQQQQVSHFSQAQDDNRRSSSTMMAASTSCWKCQKNRSQTKSDSKGCLLCENCGHIQDVIEDINYFELLNCPNDDFNVDGQKITKQFRQLQALVHPDKYSNKSLREQNNSANWSALLNKAYKTLSVPIERGEYVLKLHGEHLPKDNSALDKAFLMAMMERNEEVDEAETSVALQQLNDEIVKELNQKVDKLSREFAQKSLEAAKSILVEMKYLLSIQKTIKKKQQALM